MKKKKKVVVIAIIVVAIVSAVAYMLIRGPNPLDPEAYRKLSEKKWERIHGAISPTWSIEDKVSEDVRIFTESGEKERRRLFKELEEELKIK